MASNAGERFQFRVRGLRHWSGVAELLSLGRFTRYAFMHSTVLQMDTLDCFARGRLVCLQRFLLALASRHAVDAGRVARHTVSVPALDLFTGIACRSDCYREHTFVAHIA
jgi:hypothetical protein